MKNRKPIVLTPRGEAVCAYTFFILFMLVLGLCGYIETMP